jgi:phosphatidylcholine synthase
VRGSGNVFRDFGYPGADVEQTKAILAAKIIGVLEDSGLSTRQAEAMTDGALARWSHVKTVLPGFDGALLDNIVDYMTYTLAPMALLWSNGYLPDGTLGGVLACAPLLASCYQFCRSDAKTDDHFFLGFPSYWNIVAFYVIVFGLTPVTVGAMLLVCSVLAFVPVRYVYPSRTIAFRKLTLALTSLWLISYVVILVQMPDPNPILRTLSLLYLV